MTIPNDQRSNLPLDNARIEPRGYYLALSIHPPVRLERKKGYEFASLLSGFLDPRSVSIEDHQWTFSQPVSGSVRSQLQVVVLPNQVQVIADFPRDAKEWFEGRQLQVLKAFGNTFSPVLILDSAAMIRGTLPIDGDARTFLAQHLMNMGDDRFREFRRPIQLIGLKLVFPPFQAMGEQGVKVTDSLYEVHAESLLEDPAKLFLEISARWQQPLPWSGDNLDKVIQRQQEVTDYLEQNVAAFLRQAASGSEE
ncbi:MAG: hypothetical protein AAB341_04125 [Planctomycetota bacterium]